MPHTFLPHQQKALAYASGRSRIALFMEMRLGKTSVAIRWARDAGFRRVLVIAPLSALDDWLSELKIEGVPAVDITDLYPLSKPARLETADGGTGWFLINYDALRIQPALCNAGWDCVIVDESTKIRNPQAKITKTLISEFADVPARAILTGLPNPEGPDDYFSQMQFLHGSFMGFRNFWAWRHGLFHAAEFTPWLWLPNPGTREKIKEAVHSAAFIMTRKEANIGSRKIYNTRTVEMTPKQKSLYTEVFKKFQFEYIETNYATVRDVWLARLAGGFSPDRENPELLSNAKYNVVLDLIQGELKGQQVVIWFRFNEELEYVTTMLNSKKIKTTSFNGASSRAERFRVRDAFQRGMYQVICGQIQVGKFSMNLSAASTAIYYSNSYEAEARAQSEDRIVHVTKAQPLLYIDLVTKHTLDEAVVEALKDKHGDSASFNRRLQRYMVEEFRRIHGLNDQEEITTTKTRAKTKAGGRQETGVQEAQHPRAVAATRLYPRSSTVR